MEARSRGRSCSSKRYRRALTITPMVLNSTNDLELRSAFPANGSKLDERFRAQRCVEGARFPRRTSPRKVGRGTNTAWSWLLADPCNVHESDHSCSGNAAEQR